MFGIVAMCGLMLLGAGCGEDSFNAADQAPVAELSVGNSFWSVGEESGRPETEFGKIVGAALDRDRNVYLLDASTQSIRIFDSTGRFLRSVGRSGRGPGELAQPKAMIHDGEKTLFVLDHVNGITEFHATKDSTTYSKRTDLQIPAWDLCLFDGKIYVFGLHNKQVIHEIDQNGAAARSFGDMFGPADHATVQEVVSGEGKIACFPRHNVVVVTTRLLPEIRAYNVSNGKLLWSDSLPSFVGIVIQALPEGGYTMMPRREGYAENTVLRGLDDDVLLVQSRRASKVKNAEWVESCLIYVTRQGCSVESHSLPLLRASVDNRAVSILDTLIPVVSLVEMKYGRAKPGGSLP
jgi:hypothetical protein